MDSVAAIETAGLGKAYGVFAAIDDVSLRVEPGEIFGLLGPNGAGKSTTLRILITLVRPTRGHARVCGHDVVQEAQQVRQIIGYVPQERAIDRFLTGREHLQLLADLYRLPADLAPCRIEDLLTLVALRVKADMPAKTY